MAISQNEVSFILDFLTRCYLRMLHCDSCSVYDCFLSIDYWVNFLVRQGYVVFFDDVSNKFKIA